MKILNLRQGSPEWLAHRATHFNASDAPVMLGCSPYRKREELLRELATGLTVEVDAATQRRFDDGHRFEALARPLAEAILKDDLYPLTGSLGRYSASFDGLTLDSTTAFEHKILNKALAAALHPDVAQIGEQIPLHYRVQMEQQCMVSGATRVLFMASKWSRDELDEERHCWYYPNPELRARIVAGWEQFERDLDAYVPEAAQIPTAAGVRPDTLPALRIEVQGAVTTSNLAEFKATALGAIRGINRDLVTDEHFADADLACKWCSEVESRLAAAKQHALSQTESIDVLFKAIDDISAEARRVRLDLDKLVTARKQAIRTDIVTTAQRDLTAHLAALNARLGAAWMPRIDAGFADAIKNRKSVASIREAVGVALTNAKIDANTVADRLEANRKALLDAETRADWISLFADFGTVGVLASEAFTAIAAHRIATHKAEQLRIADEAIRKHDAEQAAKAAPVPAPAPAVAASPAAAPAPATSGEPATLNAGTICKRLGFVLTVEFITTELCVPAASTDRRATLWTQRQFETICARLQAHIAAVARQGEAVAA